MTFIANFSILLVSKLPRCQFDLTYLRWSRQEFFYKLEYPLTMSKLLWSPGNGIRAVCGLIAELRGQPFTVTWWLWGV